LDFWIGDWDVYDMPATGKTAAHATITSLLGKCVIHEPAPGPEPYLIELLAQRAMMLATAILFFSSIIMWPLP
jgi:hypothetical protein